MGVEGAANLHFQGIQKKLLRSLSGVASCLNGKYYDASKRQNMFFSSRFESNK
jgi:hypothetical protein